MAPLAVASPTCSSTFATAWASISGPTSTSLAVPGPTLSLRGGGRELLGEGVVDAGLDVDPVGADAGLAGVPELAGDGALDRLVEVGVVEDDERGVAAQLHRQLRLTVSAHCLSRILPTSVEPVKRHFRTVLLAHSSVPIGPERCR